MSDEIERNLATQICGCATEQQRRNDIKLIRAYGDQRERDALEKAVVKLKSEVTRQLKDSIEPELNIVAPVLRWAIHAILALIPKAAP